MYQIHVFIVIFSNYFLIMIKHILIIDFITKVLFPSKYNIFSSHCYHYCQCNSQYCQRNKETPCDYSFQFQVLLTTAPVLTEQATNSIHTHLHNNQSLFYTTMYIHKGTTIQQPEGISIPTIASVKQ